MKILKTVIPLLAVILSVCLTACSNDDDDVIVVKPSYVLSEVQYDDSQAILNYDNQGRYTKATMYGGYRILGYLDSNFSLSYDNNTIYAFDFDGQGTIQIKKGLLDTWQLVEDGIITYKYGDDNKMNYLIWHDKIATQFDWSGSEITSARSNSEYYKVDYYSSSDLNQAAITILNAIVISECIEDEFPWIFAQNGYLGKLPDKMIKSVYYEDKEISSSQGYYNISYGNVDSEGFPSTFNIDGNVYNLKWTKI